MWPGRIFPAAWDAWDRLQHEGVLARLVWLYGPERTVRIARGEDSETNADLAAWRALGARTARRTQQPEGW